MHVYLLKEAKNSLRVGFIYLLSSLERQLGGSDRSGPSPNSSVTLGTFLKSQMRTIVTLSSQDECKQEPFVIIGPGRPSLTTLVVNGHLRSTLSVPAWAGRKGLGHLIDQVQVHGCILPDLGQAIWPLSLSGVFSGDHICIMGLSWVLSKIIFVKCPGWQLACCRYSIVISFLLPASSMTCFGALARRLPWPLLEPVNYANSCMCLTFSTKSSH